MDILLWLLNSLLFPLQCFLISNQKRNCIRKAEDTFIWFKCHDRFENYLRIAGVWKHLETRCACKDDRRIVSNRGHTHARGWWWNVTWRLSSWLSVSQSDWNRTPLRSGTVRGWWTAAFGAHLIWGEGTVLSKLLLLFSEERGREIRGSHWIFRAQILWTITSLEKNQKQIEVRSCISGWSRLFKIIIITITI